MAVILRQCARGQEGCHGRADGGRLELSGARSNRTEIVRRQELA